MDQPFIHAVSEESAAPSAQGARGRARRSISVPDAETLRRDLLQEDERDEGTEVIFSLETIRRIFRIDPAERRIHAALFSEWIGRDRIGDDEEFYRVVAERVSQNDWEPLAAYERVIIRQGRKANKSFIVRLFRELGVKIPEARRAIGQTNENAQGGFEYMTPSFRDKMKALVESEEKQELLTMLNLFSRVQKNHMQKIKEKNQRKQKSCPLREDWISLKALLQKKIDLLREPDPAVAAEILDLAGRLQASCIEQAREEILAIRRKDLAARLAVLDPTLSALPEKLGAQALGLAERNLQAAEAAEAKFRKLLAEAEDLRSRFDAASAAENWAELDRLRSLRPEAAALRNRAGAARDEAMRALRALPPVDEASESSPASVEAEAEEDEAWAVVEQAEALEVFAALDESAEEEEEEAEPGLLVEAPPDSPAHAPAIPLEQDPEPPLVPTRAEDMEEVASPGEPTMAAEASSEASRAGVEADDEDSASARAFVGTHVEASVALPEEPEETEARAESGFGPDEGQTPETSEAEEPLSTAQEALARHLARGELAFAWHLARLTEETGEEPAVPPAAIEALILAETVQDSEYASDPNEHVGAMAEAFYALRQAASTIPSAASAPLTSSPISTLFLAALLRPAFFSGDFNARDHIAHLPRFGDANLCGDLIEALAALGYRFRLSVETLAELAGRSRTPRLPAATERLRAWWKVARHRQYPHQPSVQILQWALETRGKIGGVIEAALENRAGAAQAAEEIIRRLSSQEGREAFVVEGGREMDRPFKERIKDNALVWLTGNLEEAARLLKDWLDARESDARKTPGEDEAALQSGVGAVRKAVGAAQAALSAAPDPADPMERAARIRLRAALDDLLALASGEGVRTAPKSRLALFEEPLLRLPGGCQDWTGGGAEFAEERRARDARLMLALRDPQSVAADDLDALERHLAQGAVLPARALLTRRRAEGEGDSRLAALEQALEERREASRQAALERIARLRQDLNALSHLDPEAARFRSASIGMLSEAAAALSAPAETGEIALPATKDLRRAGTPPDFPELGFALQALEAERDRLRSRVSAGQAEALAALREEPRIGAFVPALEKAMSRLDPVFLDAALADLRDGREVVLPKAGAADGFARFFPEFVGQAAAARLSCVAAASAALEGGTAQPADFSRLDPAARRRAHRLLEDWGKAEKSFRARDQRPLREALKDLFQTLGASSVRIEPGRDWLSGRMMRELHLVCDPWRAQGEGFIPPAYGSAAGGRYLLLAVQSEAQPEQIVSALEKTGRDRACLVLVFGRMSAPQRRRLAVLTRRERLQALALDETMVLHVSAEPGPPLEAFVAAAAPFGWLQPYDANPGRAAPEMFVGREDEMRMIVSLGHEGSLIYGGRRLGKSALLDRIRQDHHRPAEERMAFLAEIGAIGGAGRPASDLWTVFANSLRQEKAFARIGAERDEILAALKLWLSERPDRRLLAMFDEADRFLRAEHAEDYPNLERLKQLMQDTGWRFKAVFAGLHNLRRMAQAPNSPLPHLGEAICVGPMNQTSGNRAALRRLASAPLRAAGFDYAEPELVEEVLARANSYPSLVQVFGREVVEAMNRRADALGEGPRWLLGRNELFRGEAAERIAAEIRNRFQLTLNLDPRYDLVAKCVAKRRLEAAKAGESAPEEGATTAEIEAMVAPWWTAALPRLSREELAELLDEMADLGVLAKRGPGRWDLLNAQVARMLGDLESLETDILGMASRDQAIDYDAAQFHRSLSPERPGERSPLSDRQLGALFDHGRPGLRIVTACKAAIGDRIGQRIGAAASQWRSQPKFGLVEGAAADPTGRVISGAVKRLGGLKSLLILDHPWDRKSARWLAEHPEVASGVLLPIWVLPDFEPDPEIPALEFAAGLWSELMLRHWLSEEGLLIYDDLETRRALILATGLAPRRILAIQGLLSDHAAESAGRRQATLRDWAQANPLPPEALGLGEDFRAALDLLRLAGPQDPAAAADLDAEREGAAARFEALGLAVSAGEGLLAPTPLGLLTGARPS